MSDPDHYAIGDALRRERDEYIARIAGLEQANAVLEGHAAEVENENKRLADQNDGLHQAVLMGSARQATLEALLRRCRYWVGIIDGEDDEDQTDLRELSARIDAALAEPSGE